MIFRVKTSKTEKTCATFRRRRFHRIELRLTCNSANVGFHTVPQSTPELHINSLWDAKMNQARAGPISSNSMRRTSPNPPTRPEYNLLLGLKKERKPKRVLRLTGMTKSFSASALDCIRALLLCIPGCQSMRLLLSRTETEISGRFFCKSRQAKIRGSGSNGK